MTQLVEKIFSIKSEDDFSNVAMNVFRYQAKENIVYKDYLENLKINVGDVKTINDIPFLPIEFFKTHKVVSGTHAEKTIFNSSGTTGMQRSNHFVTDLSVYEKSFLKSFELFYGDVSEYCVIALLPSYFEQKSSSLLYMTNELISRSDIEESGYYLNETSGLLNKLSELESKYDKILLIGVTYALLDAMDAGNYKLKHTIVMETGGMKGRRAELTKEELHEVLSNGFGVTSIHSEYGMTELLSQAYSKGDGIFACPPWMKIVIRDVYDPFCNLEEGRSGAISVIDLANINSCSFIETKDLGVVNGDTFKVLGRLDNSDIRGCNMLVQ